MIEVKEKIKSSKELDFVEIVEDQRPEVLDSESDLNYVFFCKDCKDFVDVDFKIFRWKKIYKCKECLSERIVSWSKNSLKKYFKIK